MKTLRIFAALLFAALPAAAQQDFLRGAGPRNPVRLDQRLHQQIPLDLEFTDHTGKTVRLGEYFGERPVVLIPVYYTCPMICTTILDGANKTFQNLRFEIGKEYEVVTFSFDPRDDWRVAADKHKTLTRRYGRPGAKDGWHFLTGDPKAIAALTNAIGFRFEWDEKTEQYAHGAAIVVATKEGKVARYFPGIEYPDRDLRLALVEASEEKIGTLSDAVMLLCYSYDPATGRYAVAGMNAVRAGGALFVVGIAAFVVASIRRERRHSETMGRER